TLVRDIAAQSSEFEKSMQSEFRAAVSPLREDLDRNGAQTRLLTEQVSAVASRLAESDAAAAKAARHMQATFRATEATLREEMSRKIQQLLEETRGKHETLVARLAELMGKLDHRLVEFTMRTLRVERLARNASPDLGAAEGVNSEDLSLTQPDIRDQR